MTTFSKVLLASSLALLPLAAGAAELPTYTVTIAAYVDGQPATAAQTSADGDTFPMASYWSAKNIGHGDGTYALGTTGYSTSEPYQAVTSPMTSGAKYATRAVISWNKEEDGSVVSGNCRTGKDYTLEGYSLGSSLEEAENAGPSAMHWAKFGNITEDKYIIVWYRHCLDVPTHLSPKNGIKRTSAQQQSIDWADVSSAYGSVHYVYESSLSNVRVDGNQFASPVYTSGPLNSSEIPTPGTPPGLYYWHVKAVDSAGNESWWSNPWKIQVTP